MRLLLVLGLSLLAAFAAGAAEGRRGNAHLAAGELEEAVAQYRAGLTATEETTGPIRTALWNNLGLALYQQEQFTEAAEAFQEAMRTAPASDDRARFAYNAGTALARAEQFDEALGLLRRALVARPDFPEARHNHEWVHRHLTEQQPPSDNTPPEPSAFARQLKARADSLIALHQYTGALDLMAEGYQQDSTVAAFSDFVQRLSEVVEIDTTPPDSTQ